MTIINQLHDTIVLSTVGVLWGSLHLQGGCQVHLQHAPKSKGFFWCPPLSVVTVSQSWPWVWCFVRISHRHIYPSPQYLWVLSTKVACPSPSGLLGQFPRPLVLRPPWQCSYCGQVCCLGGVQMLLVGSSVVWADRMNTVS